MVIDQDFADWLTSDGIRILAIILVAFGSGVVFRRGSPVLVRALMRLRVSSHPENAEQRVQTVARVLYVTSWITVWLIAALTILPLLGFDAGPLLAAAGIGGVALAFGAQRLVRDVLNGMFILIEDQYAIGDVVELAGKSGVVEDISLRRTVLRDLDGTVHHIPHGEVTTVANLATAWGRVNVNVPLAYHADLERAIEVIDRVGKELAADPAFAGRIQVPPRFLRVDSFTDTAVVLKVLGETKRLEQWAVAGELRRRLRIAFMDADIAMAGQPAVVGPSVTPPPDGLRPREPDLGG